MTPSTIARSALPALLFVVALLTLLFGPNLVDRFSGPEVIVQRTVTDIPWPANIAEMAGRIGAVGTMSQTITDVALSQIQAQTGKGPQKKEAPSWDPVVAEVRKACPDLTEKDALRIVATAMLLHYFGLMETALVRSVDDGRHVFPTKVVTLRLANLGGRVARNVDLLVSGNFSVAERSSTGGTLPDRTASDRVGSKLFAPPARESSKVTYHFARLPTGEDYGCTLTLWVQPGQTAEAPPREWMTVRVAHDGGSGKGRVVDGVVAGKRDLEWVWALGVALMGLAVILAARSSRLWPRHSN